MAKILIVDDSHFMREKLHQIVNKINHEVSGEAENGKKAIELFREFKPDLVIMDVTMPEMNGLEATRIIRSEFSDARIIICTAMGQQKTIVEAIEAGVKDFIFKPFDENRLIEAIHKALKA